MKQKPGLSAPHVFGQFMLSYLILLIIPLVMSISLYRLSYSIVHQQLITYQRSLLESTARIIDQSLTAIDDFSATLNGMQSVRQATQSRQERSGSTTSTINAVIQNLPRLQDSNSIASHYLIYSAYNGYALSPRQAYLNISRYYDDLLRYRDMTQAEWTAFIRKPENWYTLMPGARYIADHTSRAALLYLQPLLTSTPGVQTGVILYYVDEEKILDLLRPAFEQDAAAVLMLDRGGQTLLFMGPEAYAGYSPMAYEGNSDFYEQDVQGDRCLVTQYRSPLLGYRYTAITPVASLTAKVHAMLRTIILTMLLLLAAGVALTMLVMHHTKKPLARIASRLPLSPEGRGLWMLDSGVNRLITRHEIAQREILTQREQLRASFFSRLMNGDVDAHEIDELIRHLDIPLRGDMYMGVYVRLMQSPDGREGLEDLDVMRTVLFQALQSYDESLLILSLRDEAQIALLYAGSRGEASDAAQHFMDVYNALKYEHGIDTVWYLGIPCDTLSTVYRSFASARDLIYQNAADVENILFIGNPATNDDRYEYSLAQEQKLLNLAQAADAQELSALLDTLYMDNFVKKRLTGRMRKLLYNRLLGTVIMLADWHQVAPADWMERAEALPPEGFFEQLNAHCAAYCAMQADRRRHRRDQLFDAVIAYINGHYTSADLSLSMVATAFQLNESYLSVFIKEKLGENFSTYLERLRIDAASRLLKETDCPVAEVAQRVGYMSANSFSRAFRRVTGKAPSQAR